MITTTDRIPPATKDQASFNASYVWMISIVAAMGGLLFGYDWVVIGGAAKFYEAFFHLKDTAALVAQDAGFWAKVKAKRGKILRSVLPPQGHRPHGRRRRRALE